jgi:hypothetical protein|tara:strand:+ start:394 stop:558 length:165 start_codon:yes stop_codon:yes gene_type:complete
MITDKLKDIFNRAAKKNEKFVREAIKGIGPREEKDYKIKTVNNNTVVNTKYKRV